MKECTMMNDWLTASFETDGVMDWRGIGGTGSDDEACKY